jgi:hypothetical protein
MDQIVALLKTRGYAASEYNQCRHGSSPATDFSLISQLGDCSQFGNNVHCKVYAALYEEKTNKKIFENTMEFDDVSAVAFYINQVVADIPACN